MITNDFFRYFKKVSLASVSRCSVLAEEDCSSTLMGSKQLTLDSRHSVKLAVKCTV